MTTQFTIVRRTCAGICRHIRAFAVDESGATAIEYGLIIAGISIAIMATVFAIGAEMNGMFQMVGTKLQQNMGNF